MANSANNVLASYAPGDESLPVRFVIQRAEIWQSFGTKLMQEPFHLVLPVGVTA